MTSRVATNDGEWTTVLRPETGWINLRLGQLWRYRDLILLFVRRDFVAVYKQTILGPAWHVLQPLLTTITFTVIFGNIARLPTDGLPKFLFYMAGNVMWGYFSSCVTKTAETFVANANIFGKVYFPRLVIPVSVVLSNLISFAIQFAFFLCFLAYFAARGSDIRLSVWALLTPVLLLMMAALGLGLGIIVSALTTKYRDLRHLVTFGVQLFMYATPVIYPISSVPARYRPLIEWNPMTPIIETFRHAFLGAGTVSGTHLLASGLTVLAVLLVGLILFTRVERTFMDTV